MIIDKIGLVAQKGATLVAAGSRAVMNNADNIKKVVGLLAGGFSLATAVKKCKDAFAPSENKEPEKDKGLPEQDSTITLEIM